MVEIFGTTVRNFTRDGNQVIVFKIPALSKLTARRRANFNARVKGISNRDISEPEVIEDGDLPGQSIFSVEVIGSSS